MKLSRFVKRRSRLGLKKFVKHYAKKANKGK